MDGLSDWSRQVNECVVLHGPVGCSPALRLQNSGFTTGHASSTDR